MLSGTTTAPIRDAASHATTKSGPFGKSTATRAPDTGLVEPVHRWATGRNLSTVLQGTELAAGDFVRWCKQVIDLLDQIGDAAPAAATRATARRAVEQLRRGVVAYSSV